MAVLDLAARKVVHVLPSGPDPVTFDVSPDGASLYIANEDASELSVLDLKSSALRGRAKVGKEPGEVAAHYTTARSSTSRPRRTTKSARSTAQPSPASAK